MSDPVREAYESLGREFNRRGIGSGDWGTLTYLYNKADACARLEAQRDRFQKALEEVVKELQRVRPRVLRERDAIDIACAALQETPE